LNGALNNVSQSYSLKNLPDMVYLYNKENTLNDLAATYTNKKL